MGIQMSDGYLLSLVTIPWDTASWRGCVAMGVFFFQILYSSLITRSLTASLGSVGFFEIVSQVRTGRQQAKESANGKKCPSIKKKKKSQKIFENDEILSKR